MSTHLDDTPTAIALRVIERAYDQATEPAARARLLERFEQVAAEHMAASEDEHARSAQ